MKRLRVFSDSAIVGFSGDVSDMQYIDRLLQSIDIRENYSSHGNMQAPWEVRIVHERLMSDSHADVTGYLSR